MRLIHFIFLAVFLMFSVQLDAQHYPKWINDQGVAINEFENIVYKTGSTTAWDAGARSEAILPAGTDGYIEYTLEETQDSRVFGLSDADPNYHYTGILYSAQITSSNLVYFMRLGRVTGMVRARAGDTIKIEIRNGTVEYSVNGRVYKSSSALSVDMFADISLNGPGTYFSTIQTSFGTTYPLAWANVQGLNHNVTDETITRDTGSGWDTGAESNNVLRPESGGWFEYVYDGSGESKSIGLSKDNTTADYTSIDFCVMLGANGSSRVYRSGALKLLFNMTTDDVLRMEYKQGKVIISQNGAELYSESKQYNVPMFMDACIYQTGASFDSDDFICSFDDELYVFVEADILDQNISVNVSPRALGGERPYNYFWGDTHMTSVEWQNYLNSLPTEEQAIYNGVSYGDIFLTNVQSLDVYRSGKGNVSIGDQSTGRYEVEYYVGYPFSENDLLGASFDGEILLKTATTSSTNMHGLFNNGFEVGQDDGSVTVEVIEPKTFVGKTGFRLFDGNAESQGNQIDFGFSIDNGYVSVISSGLETSLGKLFERQLLTLSITGQTIDYLIDNELMYSSSMNLNELWVFDNYIYNIDDELKLHHNNIKDVFKPVPETNSDLIIHHVSCEGILGSVEIPEKDVCSQISYTLYDSDGSPIITNATGIFDGLEAGEYTVNVSPNPQCGLLPSIVEFEIGYAVEWEELTDNFSEYIDSNDDIHLENIGPDFLAEAFSNNKIFKTKDGWVEFDLVGNTSNLRLSLESSDPTMWIMCNQNAGFTLTMDHDANGGLGELVYAYGMPERIRIEKVGDNYTYSIDGNTIASGIYTGIDDHTFQIVARANGVGSEFVNISSSFNCFYPKTQYANLKRSLDAGYYQAVNGQLMIRYVEQYNDAANETMEYRILDTANQNNVVASHENDNAGQNVYGDNRYIIDLYDIDNDWGDQYYILEVVNEKDEMRYLKFKITDPY